MCWDKEGRLWSYHPREFVHFHRCEENEMHSTFVGAGSEFHDIMPTAFRESLPKNIDKIYTNAIASSPNGVLQIPMDATETSTQGL